jgi:antagonist of KipI
MKDAQTTGGYAKIAVVLTSDLYILGQAKPNDVVRFHEVSLSGAYARLREHMERLRVLKVN